MSFKIEDKNYFCPLIKDMCLKEKCKCWRRCKKYFTSSPDDFLIIEELKKRFDNIVIIRYDGRDIITYDSGYCLIFDFKSKGK